MADPTTGRGFLGELGLTDLSAEQASQARQRQQYGLGVSQQVAGIDRTPGLKPAERDARKIGAILGNFFGSRKFAGGGQLNDSEQAGITAVQSAQEKLREIKKLDPTMTQEMQSEKFKQILSGELALVGQVQQSMEVGKAAQQEYRARTTQELQLKKLGLDVDRTGIAKTLDEGSATRDLRGQVTPIWPKGATREDEAVMGFMKNDGTMVDQEGNELAIGEYSIFKPPTDATKRFYTANELGVSDREQANIRDQAGAVAAMARGAVDMRDALSEAAKLGAGVNIMDGSGKVTNAVTKMLEIASGVARDMKATVEIFSPDGDRVFGALDSSGGAQAWVGNEDSDNFKDLDSRLFDLVPKHLRDTAVARAKYYSALVRITFAQARTNEPGAKQLSDEDFKRALTQMAGNASDPEAFREVMLNNMQEAVASMEMRQKIIGRERFDLIVDQEGQDAMRFQLNRFHTAFDPSFGSAPNPSETLTGTPTAADGTITVGGGTFTPTVR